MKTSFPLRPFHLFALLIILASIPIHLSVKRMDWLAEKELLQPGQQAPVFRMRDEQGRLFSLAGFLGKPVWICFCSATEPACFAQGKTLNKVADTYSHRGLEIIFIADNPTPEQMEKFNKGIDPNFYTLVDRGGAVANKYNVKVIPTNFLIDKQGYIAEVQTGRVRHRTGKLKKFIEALLEDDS